MEKRQIFRSRKSLHRLHKVRFQFEFEGSAMKNGFSLIETLIALGVLSVAGTAV